MTGSTARLRSLRGQAAEWAGEFRAHGTPLDSDPDAIGTMLSLGGVQYLATAGVPECFGGRDLRVDGHRFDGMPVLERVLVIEELACGDAGLMLGSPGPSMSGVLVEQLADEDQKARFYGQLVAEPTWTFFALTEREHGSDATAIESAVSDRGKGSLELTGSKCYVGNAARARIGTVFARTGGGPLGIGSFLVDPTSPGFRAEPLETEGLRGAQICEIVMEGVPLTDGDVLGRHLPRTRRGMWASIQVFNRLRPGVAAIAVGIARAAHEYVRAEWRRPPGSAADTIGALGDAIAATRSVVRQAALTVDHGGDGYLASAAKGRACALAEEVTLAVCDLLGPGARLEHPLLDKLVRDGRGVEFMEGTRNIQALQTFQGLLTGKLDSAPSDAR